MRVCRLSQVSLLHVGAKDISLPFLQGDKVVSSWDVLDGKVDIAGKVAVIGGGLVGAETAEYLATKGCEVTIIEMTDKIARGESTSVLPLMMEDFAKHQVRQLTNTTVNQIEGNTITATQGEEVVSIEADYIVMAVGSKKNPFDETGITSPIHYVGDCSGERTADISNAIRTAYQVANEI